MSDALRQYTRIDLVAFDKNSQPVLAVEVKAMKNAREMALEWLSTLASEFRSTGRPIPYWMFVDLNDIIIFKGEGSEEPAVALLIDTAIVLDINTAFVLSPYDPDFQTKRIFDDYLLALVEQWLRDFTFDWRSTHPPLMKELADIGLAERLKGGTTHREVSFADHDPLRGNQLRDEPFPGARLGDG